MAPLAGTGAGTIDQVVAGVRPSPLRGDAAAHTYTRVRSGSRLERTGCRSPLPLLPQPRASAGFMSHG